ncbi:hypothetical protein BD560DRAFT_491195 [Blakeslea trispora]|nr:hypothetical protein BD560DRAFT_491195 [Blakeslea trispora]
MEDYTLSDKSDTVQGLFDEIEHLIDVPFEQLADDTQAPIEQFSVEQTMSEETDTKSFTFERPILIESDSDDVEEEQVVPKQTVYTLLACAKCSRPIPSTRSKLEAVNICNNCLSKKRSRSKSFTLDGNNMLLQFADKLKTSLGTSNSSLLSPSTSKPMDRRKSMPSMNSAYVDQSLDIPIASPVPSRPSSRASSFLDDVKQFLAPLSRKSSRNSLLQDQVQTSVGPKRTPSHSSLLDAINFCKPKQKRSPTPSYERRVINMTSRNNEDEANWTQEDKEVLGIHQRYLSETQLSNKHVPIRRKQIKHIESRQDRINIYNNAYMECMGLQTDLVPWIVRQTQKGPPDAWFGYVPPPREPKKFMGIFKRKSRQLDSHSLRTQQLQLGDELLNRTTPLLSRQYSYGNLSVSPGASFCSYPIENEQVELTESPISQQHQNEELLEYVQDYQQAESEEVLPEYSDHLRRANSIQKSKADLTEPPSILRKKHSSRYLNDSSQYTCEDVLTPEDEWLTYQDDEPEDYESFPPNDVYHEHTGHQRYPKSINNVYMNYSHKREPDRELNRRRTSIHDFDYSDVLPLRRKSSQRSIHYHDNIYHRNTTPSLYHDDEILGEDVYERFDYSNLPSIKPRRRSSTYGRSPSRNSHYYDDDQDRLERSNFAPYLVEHVAGEYQRPQSRSAHARSKSRSSRHYDMPARSNSYMSDEWENTLEDLCDLFPRLDKRYIDDFLRSARGDFYVAKNMILDIIMKMP